MFWKSITLHNYLPFTHSGTKHVHIDFHEPATAFLGGNGSGKSSLLRAMTPYSPVRTEFGQGGSVVKVIEHNGHLYELTSDFKNTSAPNSFKKDDVELNVSGTAETQKDLIEEHFGISKLIDDILTGDVKICSTGKSERRALFSAMYPGDLSFIIEYHKKVCSMIRACSNQLKLLESREASVRSSLIDEAERIKLDKFKVGATNLIDKIDEVILTLKTSSEQLQQGCCFKEQLHYSYDGWNMLDVRDEIICRGIDIIKGYRQTGVRRKMKDNFNRDSLAVQAYRHLDTAKVTRDRIDKVTRQLEDIKNELDQFNQVREANSIANDKSQLEERFKVCQTELNEITIKLGPNPIVLTDVRSMEPIEEELIPFVKNWVESFHCSSGSVLSKEKLAELQAKFNVAKLQTAEDLKSEAARLIEDKHSTQAKLDKLNSKPYPQDCHSVCPLRDFVSENADIARKHLDEVSDRLIENEKQYAELNKFISETGPILDEQRKLHSYIDNLVTEIRKYHLDQIAFNGEDPIDACNTHCFDILNRILKTCNDTKLANRKQNLEAEICSIQRTLSTLAAAKQIQMSMDLIEQTIKDRETKLDIGIREINSLEKIAEREERLGNAIQKITDNYKELEYRVQDAEHLLNQERVDMYVEFCANLSKELTKAKHELSEELYSVTKTLQDQEKHLLILNDEIIPTTGRIKHEKEVLEAVADGLSPTHGLPCIYLIRFINRLINRTNNLIREVWCYNMELMYLKEEDELDFSLPVIFRNSTTVYDVSKCSFGQQAVINLAMMIAICQECGFLDQYAIKFDEVDACMTDDHRTRLVGLFNKLIDREEIKQCFIVNHFAIQSGMNKCDNVCLNTEGILVPSVYNQFATIE